MLVFHLGQLETPCPVRLADTEMTERHVVWYFIYIKEILQQLLSLFPAKTSALMQNEKDASGSSSLSLRSANSSCFSWLSK